MFLYSILVLLPQQGVADLISESNRTEAFAHHLLQVFFPVSDAHDVLELVAIDEKLAINVAHFAFAEME